MNKLIYLLFIAIMFNLKSQNSKDMGNPFFSEFNTPYNVPPFDKIKLEHYRPAYEEAMKRHKAEIEKIINNPETPTFENTIVAYDQSGEMLRTVSLIFGNLNSSNTNPEMQKLAKEIAPVVTAHYDDITFNKELFKRIEFVYKNRDKSLNTEQSMLLELIYKGFVRNGALLSEEQQKRLREINQQLSVLTLQFGDNILAETNNFILEVNDEKDVAGIPSNILEIATETAKSKNLNSRWAFTLNYPSVMPFLQYSPNRELRKKIQQAYINRGNNNNEYDNKEIAKKILLLRLERARLLGYNSHADFVLEQTMAENKENVFNLLNKLWPYAIKKANEELQEYSAMAKNDNIDKIEAWDWRYYATKLKVKKYELNDEELKPYFSLENVKNGVFLVVNKLYGLKFKERKDLPVYHPDAIAYEVLDNKNKHVGIVYFDFHPRESKKSGAWMSHFRKQYKKDGKNITPIITIVCNFTKPTKTEPSLLTLEEVETFFHEFGHALHGLLSNCNYYTLSGTSVPRDFVELPSQIMEHWATHPEVLPLYAKHYKTNKPIPQQLIDKIKNANYFDQGFATTEYLAAAYLDMYLHTDTTINENFDILSFENKILNNIGLIPEIVSRYRSTYFLHIFSGGYAVGYYSYIWSEVLDCDAFGAFEENGIFDQKTATSFRQNILEKGHSDKPMNLYKNFRGKEPDIKYLLQKRGLL